MQGLAAADAEAVLAAALDQVVDAAIVIDGAGRIVLFNVAAERLWGRDRLDTVGQPVAATLPQLAQLFDRFGENGGSRALTEISLTRPDGTGAVASVGISALSVGRPLLVALARDVTAQAYAHEQLRLLSLAADKTDRGVIISDDNHRIVFVNRSFLDLLGYSSAEVLGQDAYTLFTGPTASAETMAALRQNVARGEGFHQEMPVRSRSGRNLWLYAAVNPVSDASGSIRHVVGIFADITENKHLQLLQRDALEAVANDRPLAEVMELICRRVEAAAPEVVCSVLAVDEEHRLRPVAAPSVPAYLSAVIDGLEIGPGVGACGTAAWRGEPVIVRDTETDPLWSDYREAFRPSGLKACWSSPIKLKDGRVVGTFAFYYREPSTPTAWHRQIVETCLHLSMLAFEGHAANRRIERLAYYDTLTGLPNRTLMRDTIRARLRDESKGMAFLFLDIDRFKDVNDTLGHSVGDRLLIEIARRLREEIGSIDIVSRYGGDEFVIVARDCDKEAAARLGRRLVERLLAPVVIENMQLPVSASIGIAVYPADGEDEDTLLKHADIAMYDAKAAGGGTFRFFRPDLNGLAQERLVLGSALREAVAQRQLKLRYQPQIDCLTGRLHGIEALARWRHPIFGEVSPSRFIALAEECGLIEAIGQWAIDEAAAQLAHWRGAGLDVPGVSVNLSAVHFRDSALPAFITKTLGRHGIAPAMLTIEITENVIMDDNPVAIETAKAIRALGVRLSLDDFGTGYSSLSYLSRLTIDEIKIDRGFMRDLENDASARAVVTAVVRIGQSLGRTVVAEGVETAAQREFLTALGCDVLQGYLVSEALRPDDFERWHATYVRPYRLTKPHVA